MLEVVYKSFIGSKQMSACIKMTKIFLLIFENLKNADLITKNMIFTVL